jgi:Ca2+-dependent lipid-binding protein
VYALHALIAVISGRSLVAKNSGNRSDPYCELVLLDNKGVKLGRAQLTRVIKANLNPKWDQLLEL